MKQAGYLPSYDLTSAILQLVGEISEWIGRHSLTGQASTPYLRRNNRIQTIHASLAIENNTLTLEQVTAVIEGKRVLGHPREIQEVLNAFTAYEGLERWSPVVRKDLLQAHGVLMAGLVGDAGRLRTRGVGVVKGQQVIHMAPPAGRVPALVTDLLSWLKQTREHPLVASCVFHYEFEFIHPFSDGNGRLGRLWQTLILSRWKPLFAFLPVESIIHDRQENYYRVLAQCDGAGNATSFVEFLLEAICESLKNAAATDQVTDQDSDQVTVLLRFLAERKERTALELMGMLGLSHRPSFRTKYLHPALSEGWIEMTIPDKPNSRLQRYRLAEKGRARLTGM